MVRNNKARDNLNAPHQEVKFILGIYLVIWKVTGRSQALGTAVGHPDGALVPTASFPLLRAWDHGSKHEVSCRSLRGALTRDLETGC